MDDDARYILLRHERVHLRQRRRMGDVVMAFVYLVPSLSARARLGSRAHRVGGVRRDHRAPRPKSTGSTQRAKLEDEIVRRYVGPDYGWMWPFPATVRRWFREVDRDLEGQRAASAGRTRMRARTSLRVRIMLSPSAMAVVGIDLGTTNTVVGLRARRTRPRPRRRAGPAPPAERRVVPPERRGARRLPGQGAPRRRRQEHGRERQAPHRPGVGERRDSTARGSASPSS